MDNPSFKVDDITKVRVMRIQCNRCRREPATVPALIFHGYMTVERDSDDKKDVIAIFCQGDGRCDGQAWAFPVKPDNGIVRKHNSLPDLTTDN